MANSLTAPLERLLLPAILAVMAMPASAADLTSILAQTAVRPPAQVGFREERHNAMFKEPLVLSGYLEYLGRGILRKVVAAPFEEDILVEQDKIVVVRDGKTRRLSLNRSRALKVILGAIEAVLAGDGARLEESFQCDVSGPDDAWSLRMTPLADAVAKRLTSITVAGNASAVTSIRIDLPDDEWHLMQIGNELAE